MSLECRLFLSFAIWKIREEGDRCFGTTLGRQTLSLTPIYFTLEKREQRETDRQVEDVDFFLSPTQMSLRPFFTN